MRDIVRSTVYVVQYSYVDDTYWDDGNRTVSKKREFRKFDDAMEFYSRLVQHGTLKDASSMTGTVSTFRIGEGSLNFYRRIVTQLTKRQREAVHKMEAAHKTRQARAAKKRKR